MSVDLSVLELRVNGDGGIRTLDRYDAAAGRANRSSDLLDKALTRLGAAFGVFTTVRKFVDETSAAQSAQAQLEAAIRSTGGAAARSVGQLQGMAAQLQTLSTFSDDAVQGAQSVLLTFKKIRGDTFDGATQAVLDLATRMGGDLRGAALQVGKALQSPTEGLTALRRSGVSFSDAQADIIKGLVETNRLADAQKLILQELTIEFGGSAAAARNTFGGALTAVKNAFGDLFELSRDGTSAVIEALNKTAVFLAVLNSNRGVIVDVAKYLGLAGGALFLYAQHAKVAAYWTGILAGAQAISGFVTLARSIGLAAAAMELFSKAGILRVVSLVATVVAAGAAFLGLKSIMGQFNAEYAKLQADLSKGLAGAGGSGGGGTPPGIVDEKAVDRAKELLAANRDRVRLAQQAFELVGLEGEKLEKLRIEHEATNAIIAARRDKLTEPQLDAALRSIELERQLKVAAVETNGILERRKALRAAEEERITSAISAELKGIDERLRANLEVDAKYREDRRTSAARAVRAELEDEMQLRENFVRQLQQTMANGFSDIIENGLRSFQSFFDSLKSLFIKTASDILAASATKRLAGIFAPVAFNDTNIANANVYSGKANGAVGYGSVALASGSVGYGVGSMTSNRGLGTLGGAAAGAATGAALGSVLPGIGTLIGGVVGGLVGAIGGFIGASKKATQEAIAAAAAQKALGASIAGLRASFSNDTLGAAIAQAKVQFEQLRKETEAAFSGRKNEAQRNATLAELNQLEAQRIALLQQEYAESQQKLQQDQTIRRLIAEGRIAEADALSFAADQTEKYAALVKAGADAATLAGEKETQLAEARKRAADLAESERRRIFDLVNATRAFTDPRGAGQSAFDEASAQRYADAVARGASAAELAAINTYNLAAALDRAAQILEADTRTREALVARGLSAFGDTRGAQDASLFASQRQEIVDALRDGMSPSNLALLQFVQFVEREQVALQRAIEDGTKAIRDVADKQIAAIDASIKAESERAAAEQARLQSEIQRVQDAAALASAGFDAQISAIEAATDAQLTALDAQQSVLTAMLESSRAQLQVSEDALNVAKNAYDALREFSESLTLSDVATTSPIARLAETERQFEELRRRAEGGDAGAAGSLPAAARAFLEASQGVNASGGDFQRDFARVQSVVASLTSQFGNEANAQAAQVASLRSIVSAAEAQLEAVDTLRAALESSSSAQITALREAQDAARTAADEQIDKLQAMLDLDRTASDALLAQLAADRSAVETEAARQIEQLVKLETEAFKARVAASEFYTKWEALTREQGDAAKNFYASASSFFGSAASGAQVTSAGIRVPTVSVSPMQTNADLALVASELKKVVQGQEAQIATLNQQVRVIADGATQTTKSLGTISEKLDSGNKIARRNIEAANL